MKESKLFIGNDSGLMHLAALAKVPTVGLLVRAIQRNIIRGEKKHWQLKVQKLINNLWVLKALIQKILVHLCWILMLIMY